MNVRIQTYSKPHIPPSRLDPRLTISRGDCSRGSREGFERPDGLVRCGCGKVHDCKGGIYQPNGIIEGICRDGITIALHGV